MKILKLYKIIPGLLLIAQGCHPDLDALPVEDKIIYLVHISMHTNKENVTYAFGTAVYTYQRLNGKTELITTDNNMALAIEYGDSIFGKTLDLVNRNGVDFLNYSNGTKKPDSVRVFLTNENDTLLLWVKPLKVVESTEVVFKVDSGKTNPQIKFRCNLNQPGPFIGHRFATPVYTYPTMNNGFNNRRFTAYALDSLALGNGWYRYPLPLLTKPKRFDRYDQMSYIEKWNALEDFIANDRATIEILSRDQYEAIQKLWQSQAYTYDPFRLPKNHDKYNDSSPFIVYIENSILLRSSP